jgi:Fe-S-cluster-containing hydrogenase component 2
MLANWGYQDGSGAYFIAINTDECDGCAKCAEACPCDVFEIGEDPADPLRDGSVAFVAEDHRKKLRFTCSPCKTYLTSKGENSSEEISPEITVQERKKLPCVAACLKEAITHSW